MLGAETGLVIWATLVFDMPAQAFNAMVAIMLLSDDEIIGRWVE